MKWFKFQAKAENAVEVSIFDEIGMWGVTAKAFIAELKQHAGKTVTLDINSPGGSVFDALAIYNALRAHGSEITVKVMGVAASAASLIAMAGDKIIMPENTFMMIHNPMTGTYGNADEMRDIADVLDKIGASLIGIYVARTGMAEADVKSLLDAETWLNAEEAVTKGFATEMEASLKVAASFDLARLPENIRAAYDAADDTDEQEDDNQEVDDQQPEDEGSLTDTLADEIQAAATAAGLGNLASVVAFHASVKTLDDAKAFLANAREVIALCALAKKPEMSDELVNKGASVVEARAAISDALAAEDAARHTSNVQRKANQNPQASSGKDVWAKIFPPAAAI